MVEHISARDARSRFAELTDRVKYTGEPVIVEKQGKPFVAVIPAEDLALLESARADLQQARFARLAADASRDITADGPTEDEIVNALRSTREALYRERYGAA